MDSPKMGGAPTINILIFGHTDTSQTLIGSSDSGNSRIGSEIAKQHGDTFTAKLTHVPFSSGTVALQQLEGNTANNPFPEQGINDPFISAQFETPNIESADMIVFSIQPDLMHTRWQHKAEGYVVCPPMDWEEDWNKDQKSWFTSNFENIGHMDGPTFHNTYEKIIDKLKEASQGHMTFFMMSSFDPDTPMVIYGKDEQNIVNRINRFNLSLLKLSMQAGISLVDADRVIGEIGATQHVPQLFSYSQTGYDHLLQEFYRMMDDIGFFDERPLLMQMGQGK